MFCKIGVFPIFIVVLALRTADSQEHVCLKIHDLGDKIQINCSVDRLNNIVTFTNPVGKEYGRCEAPILEQCNLPNLSQDKAMHTTTLLINKTDDIYGTWTCYHGTNIGSDTATIKKPEDGSSFQINVQDGMFSTHWKEACIGLISVILVISITVIVVMRVVKWSQGKSEIGEQQEELKPLLDTTDEDMVSTCKACTLASVCAFCSDCKKMFCEICCKTHARSHPNHRVCQIDHDVTSNFDVNCKSCEEKIAENVCITCVTEFCFACCKHHAVDNKNHVIKHLILTKRRDGERRGEETELLPNIKYKYKITTKTEPNCPPPRICGVCFINDGRIVISENHNKQLKIYRTVSLLITHDLEQEPRGMTSVTDNRVAITFPYGQQIKLYKINNSSVNELTIFPLPDKPFSIAYNYPNFAVEMGESDYGVIAILNITGEIIYKISNANSFAYFTSNTIRLALDSENRKVFVAAMGKKSVSCVDFSGNVLWRKSVPSPRGLLFLGNISERNMIIASKRWNLIFSMNSADGQNDIIMSSGNIKGPQYIDYNLDENLVCIQVDNGDVLVYEYDTTDVSYVRSDSNP